MPVVKEKCLYCNFSGVNTIFKKYNQLEINELIMFKMVNNLLEWHIPVREYTVNFARGT
jgi:hypothetical protein